MGKGTWTQSHLVPLETYQELEALHPYPRKRIRSIQILGNCLILDLFWVRTLAYPGQNFPWRHLRTIPDWVLLECCWAEAVIAIFDRLSLGAFFFWVYTCSQDDLACVLLAVFPLLRQKASCLPGSNCAISFLEDMKEHITKIDHILSSFTDPEGHNWPIYPKKGLYFFNFMFLLEHFGGCRPWVLIFAKGNNFLI